MNRKTVIVVADRYTEVVVVRPGDMLGGRRSDLTVVDRNATVSASDTEQAVFTAWFASCLDTCLKPGGVKIEF